MGQAQEASSRVVSVVRGGFWLYGISVVNNVSGFVYWLILSRIGGSELLGLTSATIGLASLVTGVVSLGVPIGVRRFLGREHGDRVGLSRYFWSTTIAMTILYLVASLLLFLLGCMGVRLASFTSDMFRVASILVFLGISSIFTSYIVSILKTRTLFLSVVLGNILKIVLGVVLVWMGFGWFGAVLGYSMIGIVNMVVGLYVVSSTIGFNVVFNANAVRDVLVAGLASWVPGIIVLFGRWLGVLFVFGGRGAVETGYYYIAFTLAGFVLAVATSMIRLLLPVLSGMRDGRKRASYMVLRIGLALVSPITFLLMVYPYVPLELLGSEYVGASPILSVLLLSGFGLIVSAVVGNLVYALGLYRDVLFLGLTQNIPRLILYYLLVQVYGGLGAAIAYVVGTYTGLSYTIVVARRIGFRVNVRDIAGVIIIPGCIGLTAYVLGLHWVLGGLLVLASYIAYMRLGLLTRSDLRILAQAFLSKEKIDAFYARVKPLIDLILPE